MKSSQMKPLAVLALAGAAVAQLDKPALTDNLDYLNQGNTDNHAIISYTLADYEAGMIPSDCHDIAVNEGYSPADVTATYVTYSDCGDAWVFCRHNSADVSLQDMTDNFGRVPTGMRDYVRHVMAFPDKGGAYNAGGNIALFSTTAQTLDVLLHESAHSLDGQGALNGTPGTDYSQSDNWINNYNMDPNVADNYAQTNQAENFAQETVVAIYDKAVPNGFGGIQPSWNNLFHQYATVQGDAGDKILQAGNTCNRALESSGPVSTSSSKRNVFERRKVAFKNAYTNLHAGNDAFNTKGKCFAH